MTTPPTHEARTERLFVRLTAVEAARLADAAAEHGVTVSAFVRDAALRKCASSRHAHRRVLIGDAAEMVRVLTAIGAHVRRFDECVRSGQALTLVQIHACMEDVQAALTRFEA